MFPDNLNDIDLVCRTWNEFVDCLRAYTETCFTDMQKRQFNRAVESPIESVHQMCMQPAYQKEYLHYAPCIKSTVVERAHCGLQYNLLVDQVEQGEVISKSTLCCSHDRFKQCVLKETRKLCDGGVSGGPASRFAFQIIEKALKFLQDQCINYIPNSGDCSSTLDSVISYSDRSDPSSVLSTAASEGWSSTTQRQDHTSGMYPSRVPKVSTTTGWMGSSSITPEDDPPGLGSVPPTQHLGTRARPSSYGRSNTWKPEQISSTPSMMSNGFETKETGWNVNAELHRPDVSASPTSYRSSPSSSTTPKFESSSSSIWNPSTSTTETWYPAAGNQLTNEVDEPNQMGWQKPRNQANSSKKSFGLVVIVMMFQLFRTRNC